MSRVVESRRRPDIPSLRRSLLAWYGREARDLPWRRTRDPYAVWISEVMLQQTTVATVIPYYERFLARFPDIASLAAADEEELLALWSGMGYYRRARNLRVAARIIVERHRGRFPSDPDAIEALPGVGRYTAGAIASNCFDIPLPALDTNAARVLSRLYAVSEDGTESAGTPGPADAAGYRPDPRARARTSRGPAGRSSPRDAATLPARSATGGSRTATLWRIGAELVPSASPGSWTQALMELGATVCRPVSPDCGICPVASECAAVASGDLAPFSLKRERVPAIPVQASLVAVTRGGRILLVRRGEGELLGGLWELPGTLVGALQATAGAGRRRSFADGRSGKGYRDDGAARERSATVARIVRDALGFRPTGLRRRASVRHAVTHRRLTIDVWTAAAPPSVPSRLRAARGPDHLWADPARLSDLPIGAASVKALGALET